MFFCIIYIHHLRDLKTRKFFEINENPEKHDLNSVLEPHITNIVLLLCMHACHVCINSHAKL